MSQPTTIQDALNQNAQGMPVLGYIVTWGADKTLIPQGDLEQTLIQYGFQDLATGLEPIPTKKAAYRALKEMATDGLVRPVLDNSEKTIYAWMNEGVNQVDEELEYQTAVKVTYWKQVQPGTPALSFSDGFFKNGVPRPQGSAAETLLPLIDQYQHSFTSRDLTGQVFLKLSKRLTAVSLRQSNGGVYFIPAAHQETLERIRECAKALAKQTNSEVFVSLFPVPDMGTAKEDMGRHAIATLLSEVKQEEIELRKMAKRMTQGGMSIKDSTVVSHQALAEDIRRRAELYRDLLLLDISKVNQALDKLTGGLDEVKAGDDPFAPLSEKQARAERAAKGESLLDQMVSETDQKPAKTSQPMSLEDACPI